jgi:Uma2 family endonuclease
MPVNTNFPPLTVENYKLLPETGPRYQLIQGDLYMAPAPNRFHQEISRNLEFELQGYLKHNRSGNYSMHRLMSIWMKSMFFNLTSLLF